MNATLCIFNDAYVIKLSGKVSEEELCQCIEIYSFEENMWSLLECQMPNVQIPSNCGAIQINEQEIMIFGGSYSKYSDRTDGIMIMQIDDDYQQFSIRSSNVALPMKESFTNDQVISLDGRVLALQNYPNPNEGKVFVHCKNICLLYTSPSPRDS